VRNNMGCCNWSVPIASSDFVGKVSIYEFDHRQIVVERRHGLCTSELTEELEYEYE
jgi:hypothetical protein